MERGRGESKRRLAEILAFLSPDDQRQHRTLQVQKDVLPYALC
jgi:hypothetical protein